MKSRIHFSGWLPAASLSTAFTGLFAAGVLSLGHLLDIPVPCGGSRGCETVASHPSSKLAGVPIALIGAAAYIVLILLLRRAGQSRIARIAFTFLSGTGAVSSALLLCYSRSVIGATCAWCITSGAAMTLLFLLSAGILRAGPRLKPVPPVVAWCFAFLLAAALGVQAGLMQKAANAPPIPRELLAKVSLSDLVDPAKALGSGKAPLTVLIFADMWCPACRNALAPLVKHQEANPNGFQLVYRHLPLWRIKGHHFSRAAAALSEMAAEQGKFWEFLHTVHAADRALTRTEYLAIMAGFGFEPDAVQERLADSDDPAVQKVLRDEALAARLGVTSTPTFIVHLEGHPLISASTTGLVKALNSPPAQRKLAAAKRGSPAVDSEP